MSSPRPDSRLTPDPARVAELGEVFTPTWLVRDILDLVPDGELEKVDATCLDPACGHGQFLLEALRRKLDAVTRPDMAPDVYRDASIAALTRIYGVDIDEGNVVDARRRMSEYLAHAHHEALGEEAPDDYVRAAAFVLERNIVAADFLEEDFPLTEFRKQPGEPGCFDLVTTRFSDQLPDDPRKLPLFAGQEIHEGPSHWRRFGMTTPHDCPPETG